MAFNICWCLSDGDAYTHLHRKCMKWHDITISKSEVDLLLYDVISSLVYIGIQKGLLLKLAFR